MVMIALSRYKLARGIFASLHKPQRRIPVMLSEAKHLVDSASANEILLPLCGVKMTLFWTELISGRVTLCEIGAATILTE